MSTAPFQIIHLSCSNGELKNVHSSLLMQSSEYFRRMIHDMRTKTLTIHITVERALQMLNFLEGLRYQFESIQNGFDMYAIGRLYQIKTLEDHCRNSLIAMIENENVCQIYEFASEVNDQIIKYNCWTWFYDHAEDILITDGFRKSKKSTVNCLVSRPHYRNLREINLFKAIYTWAENKALAIQQKLSSEDVNAEIIVRPADIRREMNFVISKIRFLTMEPTELERDVFPKNILTLEEQQGIYGYFQRAVTDYIPLSICQILDDRKISLLEELIAFQYKFELMNQSRPLTVGEKFRAEFIVTECCFMPSFKLPITHNLEKIKVTITVDVDCDNDREYPFARERLSIQQNGNVKLNPPVFIKKYSKVIITATFDSKIVSQIILEADISICLHSVFLSGIYINPKLYF